MFKKIERYLLIFGDDVEDQYEKYVIGTLMHNAEHYNKIRDNIFYVEATKQGIEAIRFLFDYFEVEFAKL